MLCLGERSERVQSVSEHRNEVRSGELKSLFWWALYKKSCCDIFAYFFYKKENCVELTF